MKVEVSKNAAFCFGVKRAICIINDLIRDLMIEHEKTIGDVVNITGCNIERVKDIVLRDLSPTPNEAQLIFEMFGVNLSEVISY